MSSRFCTIEIQSSEYIENAGPVWITDDLAGVWESPTPKNLQEWQRIQALAQCSWEKHPRTLVEIIHEIDSTLSFVACFRMRVRDNPEGADNG